MFLLNVNGYNGYMFQATIYYRKLNEKIILIKIRHLRLGYKNMWSKKLLHKYSIIKPWRNNSASYIDSSTIPTLR